MASFRRLLHRYNTWSGESPFIAIPISTCVILASGDVLCQSLERFIAKRHLKDDSIVKKRELLPYDPIRTGRMGVYAFFALSPFFALWYTRFLPALVPIKKPSFKLVTKKVLWDETVGSMYYYFSFFYVMALLEGRSSHDGIENIKENFMTAYKTDLMVWPFVQFGNFWFVPTHIQPLVISVVSVFWAAFLSSIENN